MIERMAAENPLWSRRRTSGELAKLGYEISKKRRRILHVNVTAHPRAAWAAQRIVEAVLR